MKEKKNPETEAEAAEKAEAKEEQTAEASEKEEKSKKPKKEKEPSETETLKAQLAEKEDKFLRLYAEYDNFRKRSQKEKSDIYANSKSEVINDFLPILDNFDRAAANSETDFESYRKGIEMIFTQFMQVLEKHGIESFGEIGDAFDPNIHSPVSVITDENLGENVVAQVFSKGYKLGEKIIRPAVVVVANS